MAKETQTKDMSRKGVEDLVKPAMAPLKTVHRHHTLAQERLTYQSEEALQMKPEFRSKSDVHSLIDSWKKESRYKVMLNLSLAQAASKPQSGSNPSGGEKQSIARKSKGRSKSMDSSSGKNREDNSNALSFNVPICAVSNNGQSEKK